MWDAGDPVHLTKTAYGEIGAHIASLSGDGEAVRSCVRPRLESIVPTSETSGKGNKGNVATPLWVTGQVGRPPGGGGRGRGRSLGSYTWVRGASAHHGRGAGGANLIHNVSRGRIFKAPRGSFRARYAGGHRGRR